MKFGQLTEYNMKNIFLKNHTQNVVEKLFSNSFLKNQIKHISASSLDGLFLLYVELRAIKIY